MMAQAIRTTTVPWMTWFWLGHSTFRSSPQDSTTKRRNPRMGPPRCSSPRPRPRSGRDGGSGASLTGGFAPRPPAPARAGSAWVDCWRRARRCARVCLATSWPLPRLAVQRVAAAPTAVLVELDAVRRVPLGLLRLIVAALAVRASERDCDSDSGCHGSPVTPGDDSGGRTRTYDTRIMIPLL